MTTAGHRAAHRPAQPLAKDTKLRSTDQRPGRGDRGLAASARRFALPAPTPGQQGALALSSLPVTLPRPSCGRRFSPANRAHGRGRRRTARIPAHILPADSGRLKIVTRAWRPTYKQANRAPLSAGDVAHRGRCVRCRRRTAMHNHAGRSGQLIDRVGPRALAM